MSGDYLWDRRGPRDPEVTHLEAILAPLGQTDPAPALRLPAARRAVSAAFVAAASIAAALVAAALLVVWRSERSETGLSVTALAGTPTIGARAIRDHAQLAPGRWIRTDAQARAAIDIGDIGQVDLDPLSELGLISTRPGDYRLHLVHGTIHARIWAPPGQLSVETPSSTTVDLGCATP